MDYISTRGNAPALDFAQATLTGLAADGGLYLPREWPQLSHDDLRAMRGLSYQQVAQRVMAPFVAPSLSEDELAHHIDAAYARFAHKAVTPLAQLDGTHWLLELFHGPTLAFKDVALQLLGELFEHFLNQDERHLTIVGATSGDTGSAAIDAIAGRERAEIFMLHPHGRISDVQRRQMTTLRSPNVHNMALEGSFDEAQALVKKLFSDPDLTAKHSIAAVNSINWARLMAQIVYYVWAAVQLGAPDRRVAFSVPTGNFGDAYAGYAAARMGVPIERIIVATNANDILHRALSKGDYSVGEVAATVAPSMDIQVASNFERLLFDLEGRDGSTTAARMLWFDRMRKTVLSHDMRRKAGLFASVRADADETAMAMRRAHEDYAMLLDPHSAIGLHGARTVELPADVAVVTLATAHPAKFRDAVERATGIRPSLPARIGSLFDREEAFDVLPCDYEVVRDYIGERAT